VSMGGGGYGDPLERDPRLVALDVERRLVTAEWAERTWGVVLDDGGSVDEARTAARRRRRREERRRAVGAILPDGGGEPWVPGDNGVRLSEALFVDLQDGRAVYRCRCGRSLGPTEIPYKHLAVEARFPVQRIGPEVNPQRIGGGRFELREFYCPGCFTLLEVEIARPEDPVLDDARLAPEWVESMHAGLHALVSGP
jgi:N-methylhydantoinase B